MSELVDGSAWMNPPVDGPAEAETGAVACGEAPPCAGEVAIIGEGDVDPPPPPPPPELNAERSTVASLTASAFFNATTQMLPLAAFAPTVGWSSFATSERMLAMRDGFGARTSSELLRLSTMIDAPAPPAAPGSPGAPATAPESVRRCTIGARSAASACCSGITSTSPAAGVSIAAMILAMRCRLSA